MGMREDRRPTLASWPKRIYEWEDLPRVFLPGLEPWRKEGLPPGNVTYIPRVNQYADAPEYAVAWFRGMVLVQTLRKGVLEVRRLDPGSVAQVRYRVQLLRCQITAYLRDGGDVSFAYNKTKEELILPVLNLLLGNPAEFVPPAGHPAGGEWDRLRQQSYAMHHTSLLCYRFGGGIHTHLWLRGKEKSLLYFLRKAPPPEYFLGAMDRGLAAVVSNFYGIEAAYLPWGELRFFPPADGAGAFRVEAAHGPGLSIPLLPGQEERVRTFLGGLPEEWRRFLPDS